MLAVTDPPADTTTTYVILGAACLFIVYVMMRMTKKSARGEPETRFAHNSLSRQRQSERDMENLLVELSKMSREMSAQLDTRAAKLEALVQDADERIARLDALNRQAPPRPDFAVPAGAPANPSMPTTPPPAAADDMAPSPSIDPTHAEVYRLADEGHGITRIAGELNRPHGEVELILALRPRG